MGYLVMTSGRVLLTERDERAALPELVAKVASSDGRLGPESSVGDLEELASYAGARAVRDGDWVLLATDKGGDPKWSEQASTFYAALSEWVPQGEVRLSGEDGAAWSYSYSPAGVIQDGVNGWDGSAAPAPVSSRASTPLSTRPAPPPTAPAPAPSSTTGPADTPAEAPAYGPPAGSQDPFWAMDEPQQQRSPGRTLGMVALLIGGVFLIVMVAMLAAGIAG